MLLNHLLKIFLSPTIFIAQYHTPPIIGTAFALCSQNSNRDSDTLLVTLENVKEAFRIPHIRRTQIKDIIICPNHDVTSSFIQRFPFIVRSVLSSFQYFISTFSHSIFICNASNPLEFLSANVICNIVIKITTRLSAATTKTG